MKTHTYPTNLTDAEWARLEPLLPVAHTGTRDTTVYAPS